MAEERHRSTLKEGIITGALGATAIVAWFAAVDLMTGRPFYTPQLLGEALFSILGPPSDESTAIQVAAYTLVHYAIFALIGTLLVAIVHRADTDPNVLAGLLIAFAVFVLASWGFVTFLSQGTRFGTLAWYQIGAATILSALVMAWYLWRKHPQMTREFRVALEGRET